MSRPETNKVVPMTGTVSGQDERGAAVHPTWQAVIRYCQEMKYGEIACLKIHDGLPVSAEVIIKKIRWC
ncbi:MAG TPA: hypothetical protein VNB49_02565 [Candidatus Dormibacteraeota bacterium]|nr:hypothetical protein [Candidatus Dormibacteraeota bacterium]